jgi:hypothetical protein
MRGRILSAGIIFLLVLGAHLSAQDFGFGFSGGGEEDATSSFYGGGAAISAAVHGEISASAAGYTGDFSHGLKHIKAGEIFSGKLNFSAESSRAEGLIKLKFAPGPVYYDEKSPVYIDEAYLRAYFGRFDVEAGLRKLSWGKADSLGPLDVINPLDSSELYPAMADSGDLMDLKIPRPLVHASLRLGQFSKLEGVFVPIFEPHRFAKSGRWAPARMALLSDPGIPPGMTITLVNPDTATLDYAQAGLRFTTTIGSSDLGAQYYYGRLPRPAVEIWFDPAANAINAGLLYNPYHQAGIDYARVFYGFNVRAEFAANITEDIKGEDASVYNPALAWSLGFDRDLFFGINLNVQADETIRLMNGGLGGAGFTDFDIEGGTDMSATRITATLSRKFLRDELEFRTAVVWGVEDRDFVIMPALIWTRGGIKIACSGGVFGGDKAGQLGQYHDNGFVKAAITYSF